MLRALRQCRALAVALLLAAPGLGGTWLSVAHPCPVDAGAPDQQRHAHDGHGSDADTGRGGHAQCACLGSCHAPSLTAPVQPVAESAEAPLFDLAVRRPAADVLAPPAKPFRLHPPSTAPPPLS